MIILLWGVKVLLHLVFYFFCRVKLYSEQDLKTMLTHFSSGHLSFFLLLIAVPCPPVQCAGADGRTATNLTHYHTTLFSLSQYSSCEV